MLSIFPGIEWVFFLYSSSCCLYTSLMTIKSLRCFADIEKRDTVPSKSLIILRLRLRYCSCIRAARRISCRVLRRPRMKFRKLIRAFFRYVRGFSVKVPAVYRVSIIFSVFCRASSRIITSCGCRISCGKHVASRINCPLFR